MSTETEQPTQEEWLEARAMWGRLSAPGGERAYQFAVTQCATRLMLERQLAEERRRLEWLAKKEARLTTHRERSGDRWLIWWNVVKRNRSLSGHPLGSPAAAIDAAMAREG